MTEQEIKEFWEKLGFEFVPRKESPRFGREQDYWAVYDHWIYPDGTKHKELPTLRGIKALGNLFKWAVPKLEIEDDWRWEVLQEWFYNAMRNNNYKKDPTKSAIALFRAIQQVIKEHRPEKVRGE